MCGQFLKSDREWIMVWVFLWTVFFGVWSRILPKQRQGNRFMPL